MLVGGCVGVILAGCVPSRPDKASRTQREAVPAAKSEAPRASSPSSPTARRPTVREPLSRSPQQVAALDRVDQAKTLIAEGNYNRAISNLEKALSLDSTNPRIYFYLASAHYQLSHFRESLDFLEVAESFMDGGNISRTEVLILKGDSLRGLGRLAEARQSYEDALAVDPRNEKAISRLRLVSKRS